MVELKIVDNGENRTILIKEDYEFSAMVLRTILSEEKYNSKTIKNLEGFEGIKIFKNSILFYDLNLDSQEDEILLKNIKKKYPKLKIIMINYVGQKIDIISLKEKFGIEKIIQRPFSRREIISAIDN